jgi:hypothetical protein
MEVSQGGLRARQGGARQKAPQGHKYNPLGAPIWLPIEQSSYRRQSPENRRRKMRERVR